MPTEARLCAGIPSRCLDRSARLRGITFLRYGSSPLWYPTRRFQLLKTRPVGNCCLQSGGCSITARVPRNPQNHRSHPENRYRFRPPLPPSPQLGRILGTNLPQTYVMQAHTLPEPSPNRRVRCSYSPYLLHSARGINQAAKHCVTAGSTRGSQHQKAHGGPSLACAAT